MSEIPHVTVDRFKGLDLRRLAAATTPDNLLSTKNIELKTGGGLRTRSQLRLFATLDDASIGLYTVGDGLRAAYPMGNESLAATPQAPTGIRYDLFSNRTTFDISWVDPFDHTVLRVDNVAVWKGQPYLNLARDVGDGTTKNEHHFCSLAETIPLPGTTSNVVGSTFDFTVAGAVPASIKVGATVYLGGLVSASLITAIIGSVISLTVSSGAVPVTATFYVAQVRPHELTLVSTPFAPGKALILAAEKIWANDIDSNDTWFSSTIYGPTNWTNPGDAGFIPTSKHVSGSQTIQGFGIYNSQLAVFYNHALQVWQIGADPASHEIVGDVGGAGTDTARSVVNVMGDVFYFSEGGFRSVKAAVITGQLKEGDIGSPIQVLTATFDPLTESMVSFWSESRSQYISFTGITAYILTYSPSAQIAGWTTWEMPWEISDVAEAKGELYVRRAGTGEVYTFDTSFTGEPGFEWAARPAYLDAGASNVKDWLSGQLIQEGVCEVYAYENPRKESRAPIQLVGSLSGAVFTYTGPISVSVLAGAAIHFQGYEELVFLIDTVVGHVVTLTRTPSFSGAQTAFATPYAPVYLGRIEGITEGIGVFAVDLVSNRLSLEFRGTTPWELDSFTIQYKMGNLF